MNAAEALRAAQAAKVSIKIDGEDLVLVAPAAPPAALLQKLSLHKAGIVAMLRRKRSEAVPTAPAAEAEAWKDRFEERCGILEFDHGLPRPKAEVAALQNIVVEWIDAHPEPSQAGWCAHWGQAESAGIPVTPYGVEPGTHVWLHGHCRQHWHEQRRAIAAAALAEMGIWAAGA